MGRKSNNDHNNILLQARLDADMTRADVYSKSSISSNVLQRIEKDASKATPQDVVNLSKAYGRKELCNYYCSNICEIGQKYVPHITNVSDLPKITLGLISSLKTVENFLDRFIEISADGEVDEEEQEDFELFKSHLDELSLAIESLKLWGNE